MKYEEAINQLEDIVRKMEGDELDIDALGTQLKKANELIKCCRDKLTKSSNEITKILSEEQKK